MFFQSGKLKNLQRILRDVFTVYRLLSSGEHIVSVTAYVHGTAWTDFPRVRDLGFSKKTVNTHTSCRWWVHEVSPKKSHIIEKLRPVD